MSSANKCTVCQTEHRRWTDATCHARLTCDVGHVTGMDLCGEHRADLETEVATCGEIATEHRECRQPTSYPEFTPL
jgi:hypothetical protein